jgi:hypothetical protein
MRSLRFVLSSRAVLEVTPWHLLLLCAAVAAAWLLSMYVGLLHDSMARGAQWRVDHQTTASTHTAKAARIPRSAM